MVIFIVIRDGAEKVLRYCIVWEGGGRVLFRVVGDWNSGWGEDKEGATGLFFRWGFESSMKSLRCLLKWGMCIWV